MGGAARWRQTLVAEATKFSAVGLVAFVLDVATFNVLRLAPAGVLGGPLVDKTAGVVVATVFAWLGSRYWTFRRAARADAGREFAEFILVALVGYAVTMAVLFTSHDVLGFTSLWADNIAANVVGALLGTVVRFTLYRQWVYRVGRTGPRPS